MKVTNMLIEIFYFLLKPAKEKKQNVIRIKKTANTAI